MGALLAKKNGCTSKIKKWIHFNRRKMEGNFNQSKNLVKKNGCTSKKEKWEKFKERKMGELQRKKNGNNLSEEK